MVQKVINQKKIQSYESKSLRLKMRVKVSSVQISGVSTTFS